MSAPFVASQATVDVLCRAHAGARDLHSKLNPEFKSAFDSRYKEFALNVMRAATKEEKKELNLSQTVRHLLVFDVAGDGKCQLRALEVSQRPIFPTQSSEPFCQLNTTQLFGMEVTTEGQKFVTLEQENSIIRDRLSWVQQQYKPGQPHFEAIVTALVSEMQDLSISFIENLRQTIADLESRINAEPANQAQIYKRIAEIRIQIKQKEEEDAYLGAEVQDPKWFCANSQKLGQGLEKILGNECGNFWFSLYKEAFQFPIIHFVQKGGGENHFIEFTQYLGAPARPCDKQLASAVKVGGHWKAVMPLNDDQYRSLNERGLIQRETQVFHARDDGFNRWYLEGNLTGITFHNKTPPIGLTSELKRLCDSAPKGDQSRIERYLRTQYNDRLKQVNLIQEEGTWVLMVTTKQGEEFCLYPRSPIANEAPVQQPAAARPSATGGGAARPSAAGGGAAKPPVQPAAAGGGAAVQQPLARPAAAGGGAAKPQVQSAAAKSLEKLDVKDSNLVTILQQGPNHEALRAYLNQFQNYFTHTIEQGNDGWVLEVVTSNGSKQFRINDPDKSAKGCVVM